MGNRRRNGQAEWRGLRRNGIEKEEEEREEMEEKKGARTRKLMKRGKTDGDKEEAVMRRG